MTAHRSPSLRSGFTTGTAAAAATGAAVLFLLAEAPPSQIPIRLPDGAVLEIPVHAGGRSDRQTAWATVVKDGGDDPDATHRAEIGARATLSEGGAPPEVTLVGGPGVGRVTKPGLEVPPGEAAINPVPREMIRRAALDALSTCGRNGGTLTVEIFVPQGADIARRTLNARLGIVGGISILGTTGRVRPMSHAAYIATIQSAFSVARAAGLTRAVLTTGRRGERHAQTRWPELPEEAFVQIGDFFQRSLELAADAGFAELRLAVFFGKALKMAEGTPHTHAARSRLALDRLSRWTAEETGDPALAQAVAGANTAREAFFLLQPVAPTLFARVGERMIAAARNFAGPGPTIRGVIFDFDGSPAWDAAPAAEAP
jgi:cobalt-precorrin-5B (C1)-methyltransferase